MAELEKRLKRRAVSDTRLRTRHGDIVAPEYQQQADLLSEGPSSNSTDSLNVVSERSEEAKPPSRGHYKYVSTPIGNRGIERKAKSRFTTDGTGPLSPPKPFTKNNKTEQPTKVPLKVPAQLTSSSKQPIVRISFNQQLLCPITEPSMAKEGAGVKELARVFSSLSKQNKSPPSSKNVSPLSGRKPFTERTDTGMEKELCSDSSSGGVSEASRLEDNESVTREDLVNRTPDDQQPNNCSTTAEVQATTARGDGPKSMYMNVFDDDTVTKPGSPKPPLSPNNPKKPIPTPRRTSEPHAKLILEAKKKLTGSPVPSGDALHHVVSLTSLGENSDQSDPEESGHTPLARSTSSGSTNVICRRTTPKAQKELRKGVVTDGEMLSSPTSPFEADEYITMNPTQRQRIILSTSQKRNRAQTELLPQSSATDLDLRNRSESTASTQSSYYLQVLPGTPNTPPQCTPSPPPPQIPDRPQVSSSKEPARFEEYIPMSNPKSSDSTSKSPLSAKKSLMSIQPIFGEACPRNRSQGSVFAREMLSYAEDRVKLAKHSVPGTGRRVSPAQGDAGPMYIEWHEYIDIDPAEIARQQKAVLSPPKVPPRPDVFPSSPVSSRGTTTNKSYKTMVTFVPTSQDSLPPPPPPPKSDSLLREQRALPPPPLVKGRSQTTLSVSPPKPSRAKEIIRALKREAFNRTPRKGRSSGSPLYPPPRLHSRDHGVSRLERSFSDPSLLEPTPTESNESLTTISNAASDKSSFSNNDISSAYSSDDERGRSSTVLIYEEPLDGPRMRQRSGAVRNQFNRDSLALILKHRDVIAQRLSTQGHPLTQPQEDDEKRGKETLIRSLGNILLEIDGLLRTSPAYTEEDLVSAIERELKVNLRGPAPQQDSPPSEPASELTDQDVDDVIAAFAEEDEEEEVGSPIRPRKSPLRRSLSDAILLEPAVRKNRKAPTRKSDGIELDTDDEEDEEEELDMEEEEEEAVFTQSLEHQKNHRLQRTNAQRRPSATADDIIARFNSITNGAGYVTHTGARLQNIDTQVIVDIPKGALSRGKQHRLW